MSTPVAGRDRTRAEQQELDDQRLARVRERIRRNMPKERSPLQWRQDGKRMVSHCGQFAIEKSGKGDATRYTAKLVMKTGETTIGHRQFTFEAAKQICCNYASPLPLEPGQHGNTPEPATPTREREPGEDDESPI